MATNVIDPTAAQPTPTQNDPTANTNTGAATTTTAPAATMPTQTQTAFDPNSVSSAVNTKNAAGIPQMTAAQVQSSPTWNNTADQTTAGQLTGIINSNSPLMQQAKTNALQSMNDRGLLNSSMANTAGQQAVMGVALPIAQNDAAQASKVAQTNVANTNADQAANVAAQNAAAAANLQAGNQQSIADIEAQYKELTQGSSSAASILNNAQNQIAAIVASNTMDAAAKNRAIADIKTNLSNSMNMIGSLAGNIDLSKYLPAA